MSISETVKPFENRNNFFAHVTKAFAFIEDNGYHIAKKEGIWVRYESKKMYVQVYQGIWSYAVDVEVGRFGEDRYYNSLELFSLVAPELAEKVTSASNEDELIAVLKWVANAIREKAMPIIFGNEEAYIKLQITGDYLGRLLTYSHRIKVGDEAWRKRDSKEALRLYEPACEALDAARINRLEALRKGKKISSLESEIELPPWKPQGIEIPKWDPKDYER